MELVEQLAGLDAVFVAVGGGGYIAGIGTVLRQLSPNTQLIACWPENATSMYSALEAGHIFRWKSKKRCPTAPPAASNRAP